MIQVHLLGTLSRSDADPAPVNIDFRKPVEKPLLYEIYSATKKV